MTGGSVTGTIRVFEGRLFIERDDGACPNVFLHKAVAQWGGFEPPYEGRRVRCEIVRDGMGNCAAANVTPADALVRSGGRRGRDKDPVGAAEPSDRAKPAEGAGE
jgi:cold shock CspA family protein